MISKNDSYDAATVGSRIRLYEVTKSLAVTGVPSLYFSPERILKVQVRPSGEIVQLDAAAPSTSDRSPLGRVNASNTMRPTAASYTHCCCVGSSVPGSVSMFTRRTCLSGGAWLFPVVVVGPHATAANTPAVASANARMLTPRCIRVLPLRLFLRPSSRRRGENAPAGGLSHTGSAGKSESVVGGLQRSRF